MKTLLIAGNSDRVMSKTISSQGINTHLNFNTSYNERRILMGYINKTYYGMYVIIHAEPERFVPLLYKYNIFDDFEIVDMYDISNYGTIKNRKTGNILCQTMDDLGYCRIGLSCNDIKSGKSFTRPFLVHRLVAMTFVDGWSFENDMVIVNHLNSDPSDNYYENLEWCTQHENLLHATAVGRLDLVKRAEMNSILNTKYTIKYVEPIAKLFSDGYTPEEICSKLDIRITRRQMYRIIEKIKYDDMFKVLRDKFNIIVKTNNIIDESVAHEICRLLEAGDFARDIIVKFGITDDAEKERWTTRIYKIRHGDNFKEISSQYNIPKTDATFNKKYSDEDIIRICELFSNGKSIDDVINIMNLSKTDKKVRKYLISLHGRFIRKNITKNYKW